MNLFDFNTQQSAFDENKAKSFVDRWKQLWKTRDEIKSAYDKAKADWLFNTTQATPSRVWMWIKAWEEAFKSWVNKTQSWFEQIWQAFQPETSVPRNDYKTQAISPNIAWNRDISNRVAQFWRWLANVWWWAIETIFGTALWPIMWVLNPELSAWLWAIANTKVWQETEKIWNWLSPQVKEWIINVTDMVWLKWTSLTAWWAKTIIQDIAKRSPELLNNVWNKIWYATWQAVWQPVTLAKKWLETTWDLLSKWAKKALPIKTVTRTIPEKIVSWDLWFTPTERKNIEKITWKTESQYILDKWLAWKWKNELAEYFAKQANDNYKWIDTKLSWLKDIPKKSEVTTDALKDILDQLTSSDKLKRAYTADIQAVKDMLARWKYTLLEKHRIRQAFDNVNTWMFNADWTAKSWPVKKVDLDIRRWISDELQKWALKQWIDVKAMNNELRAWIEMKDALLRRLSQEEKNNFLWLQDIWVWAILSWWDPFTWLWLVASKKYLEWIAPSLSQRLYNLNKAKNETSRMTRGNPITNTNKSSKLGLVTDTRTDLVSKPLKKAKKPLKKTTKKNSKNELDEIYWKPVTLKEIKKLDKDFNKQLIRSSVLKKYWLSTNKEKANKQINDLEVETYNIQNEINLTQETLDDFSSKNPSWRSVKMRAANPKNVNNLDRATEKAIESDREFWWVDDTVKWLAHIQDTIIPLSNKLKDLKNLLSSFFIIIKILLIQMFSQSWLPILTIFSFKVFN